MHPEYGHKPTKKPLEYNLTKDVFEGLIIKPPGFGGLLLPPGQGAASKRLPLKLHEKIKSAGIL